MPRFKQGALKTDNLEAKSCEEFAMPMDFLRRIEEASFPLAILDEADIQCAAVLLAANFIEANPPEPGDRMRPSAMIFRITPLGRAELARLRPHQA